jgi:GNAT superfamily N-acetyltransferase
VSGPEEVSLVFRTPVQVREANPGDADALALVWGPHPDRPADGAGPDDGLRLAQEADASVARIAADPDQRLLVAAIDDVVAGAVHLTRGQLSPVRGEDAVFVIHLHVIDRFRRHGVGRALIEASVTWAEEKEIPHVIVAASVSSRDANRFMARLGLGQIAIVRGATTAALRAKLPVDPPVAARVGTAGPHRNVGAVLARRRSMRRMRARPE